VGIGTTSPDAQLDVTRSGNGQIAVLQTSASRGFSFDSQSDTALQIASIQASTNMDLWANTLSFSAGGSERMRIDSGGAVGIGNTNAASFTTFSPKLVVGSGSGGQRITIYSGAGQEGDLIFADGTTGNEQYRGTVRYDHADDAMKFYTNGGINAMIINSAQGVQVANTVGVGAATPSTSGAGITFPATQSASSNANTLDDYEEGTWTPTIAVGSGSLTYSVQFGQYTKIGNVVTIAIDIRFTASVSGTAIQNITLPFTAAYSTSSRFPAFAVGAHYYVDIGSGTTVECYTSNGQTTGNFHSSGNNTNQLPIYTTAVEMTFRIIGSYLTS
jgi:hypothetical protein